MSFLPKRNLSVIFLVCFLVALFAATSVHAQDSSPTPTPTESASSTPTATPTDSASPTATASATPTAESASTSTTSPSPSGENKEEVLGDATVLGATNSTKETLKWILVGATGIFITLLGLKIARTKVEE